MTMNEEKCENTRRELLDKVEKMNWEEYVLHVAEHLGIETKDRDVNEVHNMNLDSISDDNSFQSYCLHSDEKLHEEELAGKIKVNWD